MRIVNLSQPDITENEIKPVIDVLKSGFLASGRKVAAFEKEFAEYTGTKHAIAVSSGTTALHTSLIALGVGSSDYVLTTPFTFIATANAVLFCGAKPVFCDINPDTFNLDPNYAEHILRKNKKIKAMILVHLYGLPCEMDDFCYLADKYNVKIIEDCAQSAGALYSKKHTGSYGSLGCFSFYATKNMMTGEGGMIVTDSGLLAGKCRKIINHGRHGRFIHGSLGYNYRMTDIAAAIGLVQLSRLDEFTRKRIENACFYNRCLGESGWIKLQYVPGSSKHVYHQYAILVPLKMRNRLVEYLNKGGIMCAPIYPLTIPEQPFYRKMGYKVLPKSKDVSRRVICLPVHTKLTKSDLERVVSLLKDYASQ